MATDTDPPEELFFEDAAGWEQWLAAHHATTPKGVRLKFAKKASGIRSLAYAGALDVALCYGWIDGQSKTIDEVWYTQKFTPRRAKSIWSKRNIGKVTELIALGRMRPAGLAEIEAAKQDGRWERAYDSPKDMAVPADFQEALDANPAARDFFKTLSRTNSYALLWRIQTAVRPETRQARITKFVQMLADGQVFHP